MTSKLNDFLYALTREPEFKSAWSDVEPELVIKQFLTEERQKKGLTRERLAELSGVPLDQIRLLESGKGDPSPRTLQRLASVFGKQIQLLFV